MDFTIFFIGIVSLVLAAYWFIRKNYSYWADQGVSYVEPRLPYGNMKIPGKTQHLSQTIAEYYNLKKGSGPFCGIYFFLSPVALALDVDFIRNVLIKDFQYFQDRGAFYNEKVDPLSAHLVNLEPGRWKVLRSKLTPTFTSGKMKFMLPTIVDVADQFHLCLKNIIKGDEEVLEMRELLGRFTTDVIGTCAFGIDCNSLKDPNAKFRQMGRKVFESPKANIFSRTLMNSFQGLAKMLKMRTHHKDVTDFFLNVVKETVAYREKNNVQRNDFMNLLIQLKNEGQLSDDPKNDLNSKVGCLTIHEIAAQAYVFFLAGFETSSTALTFCLYELAIQKDLQIKARSEINTVLQKYDGKLTYEAVGEMVYIDHIINESLRKYPPAADLIRVATKDYKVPDTNITLPKNTTVLIPAYAIHHDPEYYPDPEKFIPERFEPEQVKSRPNCTFLPFGDGPRNCIGLRFGMLQARVGLITLLKSFEFSTTSKTQIPLRISAKHSILAPIDGLWLNVRALD